MSLFAVVLLGVVVLGGVVDVVSGDERKINNAEDFVLFSNDVNNGTNHSGTTVFLESDIDFSGNVTFEPIGVNSSISFRGVFDGQGHVIRNLVINSSAQYVGLFGRSPGLTIRNVVMDESCSVEGFYNVPSSSDADLGGIIGYCYESNIENSVNMARVTFSGNANYVYLGGIVGYIYFSKPGSYVENCVNYGSVAFSGSGNTLHLGGIVGRSQNPLSTSQAKPYIQNCINYGTLSSNDALTTQNIGGIVGYDYYGIIKNCLSAGRISSNSSYIGSIISLPLSSTNITHSFWTNDVGCDNVSGSGTPSIDSETSKAELDAALWNKLNNYSVAATNTSWLLLHMNGGQANSNITKELLVSPSKHLPAPKKEWHTFAGWFVDSDFSEEYEPDGENIPTDVYAKFTPNNYTVSFNVSGGDELSVILSTKEVAFNATYGNLPEPTRAGYTFLGWFTDANESVTNETIVSTPSNHTLYAHWEETPANHVEITFNTKDLSKKDIEKIVRQYTDAEFTIVEYEKGDGSEGTRVIIRFTDAKDAVTFVDFVRELSDETKKLIQRIDLISDYAGSFSSMFSPILFFYLM